MFSGISPNNAIKAVRGKIVGQADSWMQVMKKEKILRRQEMNEREVKGSMYHIVTLPSKRSIKYYYKTDYNDHFWYWE